VRRNKLALFLHLVWATWDRLPLIDPALERRLHRMMASLAQDQGCKVLALNGMPDHVHIVVSLNSRKNIIALGSFSRNGRNASRKICLADSRTGLIDSLG
jgi:REP element-mobilizing transposase RayT